MKRMISKNIILGASLAALMFTSCSKTYLDVNNDPNRPTDENITPQLIFTQAEQAVGAREASGDWGFLDNWMGYFAPNGDFAPSQIEQTYNIDFSFSDPVWQNHYNVLFDLYQVKTKALASGDSVLAAASTILSAKLWQELVDLFGDIPYTQAFQYKEFPTPAFDAQKDVYNSVLLSLDTAVNYMITLTGAKSFAPADIINQGDQVKWAKFGNTIKLRMLLRQSEVSGFDPSAEIDKIQSSGGVSDDYDVSVNPGYINDVNKQSPFYANFGYDPSDNVANTSVNANTYILNILQNSGDPRIDRFFAPISSGAFVGNIYGDPGSTLSKGASTSYFGPGLVGDGAPSAVGATQDQWIYPKYETLFLEAEAIARGWLPGGAAAAKQTYEDAVTASFEFLKVEDADAAAASYLADPDGNANWDQNAGSSSSQIQLIVYQKYIANTGIDPLESYSDQRRLHFLTDNSYISNNPAKVANSLPLRLLYPQSEYTTNNSSVQAIGTVDAYTTKIFWEP